MILFLSRMSIFILLPTFLYGKTAYFPKGWIQRSQIKNENQAEEVWVRKKGQTSDIVVIKHYFHKATKVKLRKKYFKRMFAAKARTLEKMGIKNWRVQKFTIDQKKKWLKHNGSFIGLNRKKIHFDEWHLYGSKKTTFLTFTSRSKNKKYVESILSRFQ